MKRFGPKRKPGSLKVTGLQQITNSINFWKKKTTGKLFLKMH